MDRDTLPAGVSETHVSLFDQDQLRFTAGRQRMLFGVQFCMTRGFAGPMDLALSVRGVLRKPRIKRA